MRMAMRSLQVEGGGSKSPNMARWREKSSGLGSSSSTAGGSRRRWGEGEGGKGKEEGRDKEGRLPLPSTPTGMVPGREGGRSLLSPRTQKLVNKLVAKEGGRPGKLRVDTTKTNFGKSPEEFPLPISAVEEKRAGRGGEGGSGKGGKSGDLDALMMSIESMSGDLFGEGLGGGDGLGIDT